MEDEGRALGSSEFGALLREHRLAAGLSQEALAERAKMSTNGISALERGYRRSPQRETLELLAGALALSGDQRRAFEAAATRPALPRRGGASVTVGPWPQAGASLLPIALTTFVGRENELAEIQALVREHRMVTLVGSGGVGKTQTALRAASSLSDHVEGTVFVGLAPIASPSLVTGATAAALGVQEVPNSPLLETLLAYLQNKSLLLIIDNCEHVIAHAAPAAERILAGCARVRILATSREPLRVPGEHIYRLPSLSIPEAVELFADRARAVDHRFALNDRNARIVAELCRRLDGIPLAIELAAARVNVLSVKALNARLDDRFRLLAGGERAAMPRQQTIRAAIDWSYDLLAPNEQRIFERLSIFAGSFTLAAATQIAGTQAAEIEMLDTLSSLVDKSLVVADLDETEPRYHLLESFRGYAREKLEERGEADAIARRHALVYLNMAELLDRMTDSEPEDAWRATARAELDNWRAALQWSLLDRNDTFLGVQLAGRLGLIWQNFAPLEGRRRLETALELLDSAPPSVLGALSYAQASIALVLGEHREQLRTAQAAIEQYGAAGDLLGVARAQSRAGHALIYLKRRAEATALLHEALAAARELRNQRLTAFALRCLGLASAQEEDFGTARTYVTEAVEIFEGLGARLSAAAAIDDLGEYAFFSGSPELAVVSAERMVATARAGNAGARSIATALNGLAAYLSALERYDEAERTVREALELALEYQLEVVAAHALQHLAAIVAARPRSRHARKEACRRAARILGFVDARLAASGSERMLIERREYDRMLGVLREELGAEATEQLMNAGAMMSPEQAVETAARVGES
jgi:predicted ATPase/DNA-binding XRE family transcriptional regulator